MAVLRLWSGLKYNNRGIITYDYTFWFPEVLLFSCLEVDFAIICASIPIFWPAMKAAWMQITVTQEVVITSEWRSHGLYADDLEVQLERTTSLESQKSTNKLMVDGRTKDQSSHIDGRFQNRTPQVSRLPQRVRKSWGGTPLRG